MRFPYDINMTKAIDGFSLDFTKIIIILNQEQNYAYLTR